MATIKFYIKAKAKSTATKKKQTADKDKLISIMVRVTFGAKKQFRKTTGFKTYRRFWSDAKGKYNDVIENTNREEQQEELELFKSRIVSSYNRDYAKGLLIDANWLSNVIDSYHKPIEDVNGVSTDLLKYLEDTYQKNILLKAKTGEISKETLKSYKTVATKIKKFQKDTKKTYKVHEVDMLFYNEFKDYCINIQKLGAGTFGNYINRLKTAITTAKDDYKLEISDDVLGKKFKRTRAKTMFITLNEDELLKIARYDFSKTPYLDNARDWLVIGAYLGQRVGDLLNLNMSNMVSKGTRSYIERTQNKTKKKLTIPIHPLVKATIQKNDNSFPRKISSQKLNDYIKLVCKQVGLNELTYGKKRNKETGRNEIGTYEKWELTTSHCFRRSFATNHYGKLPTPVVMAITLHEQESVFLKYIDKSRDEDADIVADYWEKQSNGTNPLLNVV